MSANNQQKEAFDIAIEGIIINAKIHNTNRLESARICIEEINANDPSWYFENPTIKNHVLNVLEKFIQLKEK